MIEIKHTKALLLLGCSVLFFITLFASSGYGIIDFIDQDGEGIIDRCACDADGHGTVTPGDALIVFQKFLEICPTWYGPCDQICCDVSADGSCSPQDALEIFNAYLGEDSLCDESIIECMPPVYYPEKWNDGGSIQDNNNCYNYANDERTDTYALPGRANGCYPWTNTCSEVYGGALCDGLVQSDRDTACPDNMHKVYLVVAPAWDAHFYRQELPNGRWSHKAGQSMARDWDESGLSIQDPEQADTGWYSDHCGYLCACGDYAAIQ